MAKVSLYKEEEELHQGLQLCIQKGQLEIMSMTGGHICVNKDEEVHQLITQRPLGETVWLEMRRTAVQVSTVQSLILVRLFVILWPAACQASLSIPSSWSLPKLVSIDSVKLSDHLILYHPLFLLSSIFPSTRVFPSESALCIR